MIYSDTSVAITTGLGSCCKESIALFVMDNANKEIEEGKTIPCQFEQPKENQFIILQDGEWRWNVDYWLMRESNAFSS